MELFREIQCFNALGLEVPSLGKMLYSRRDIITENYHTVQVSATEGVYLNFGNMQFSNSGTYICTHLVREFSLSSPPTLLCYSTPRPTFTVASTPHCPPPSPPLTVPLHSTHHHPPLPSPYRHTHSHPHPQPFSLAFLSFLSSLCSMLSRNMTGYMLRFLHFSAL